MVSWIVACIAISALSAGGFAFPVLEEHHELSIPETVGGHEEVFDHHQLGLSQELHGFEPKHATSYQSFHLESKNSVPIEIKTIHPTSFKHSSSIGGHESFGHESLGHESLGHESLGHESFGHESFGHESLGLESFGHESSGHGISGIEHLDTKFHSF